MSRNKENDRQLAIQRYFAGESPKVIYISLGYSKRWFYKWLTRYKDGLDEWYYEESRKPHSNPNHTEEEIEELVKLYRFRLYNEGLFCGAQNIRWQMEDANINPLPSVRTISRILKRNCLTNRRTGKYESKHIKYPGLKSTIPNYVHQTDFVGPRYIKGGSRFYSLHSIDIATGRCAIEPLIGGKKGTIEALWNIWNRLGVPKYQQIDNEMTFYGSPAYPRGMGKVIRLCLIYGVEPYFTPIREPWRNGVVEKFNHNWDDKFFRRTVINSTSELREKSLMFETKHNTSYRYSKLGGKTPIEYLNLLNYELKFPPQNHLDFKNLPKPVKGRYNLIRFIRSSGLLDVFTEKFKMPDIVHYEYVKATIDVKKQKLYIYLDNELIITKNYKL